MKIGYKSFELELKYPFTIARFSRTSTPIMLVEISHEGLTGYGEASMVPYMGESIETATNFLAAVDLGWLKYPFNFEEVMAYLDKKSPGDPNIKAAIDIALHDLAGKLNNIPCYRMFGSDPSKMPETAYTLGIDSPDMIIRKLQDAGDCHIIKVKLGRDNDKELINTIRSVTNKPLFIDANQGWTDRQQGLDMACWLGEQGALLIEQPMPKEDMDSNAWITERSPVPIIADEAVQRFADVDHVKGAYHGINMKLMKSAGMAEGFRMIQRAKELNMKVLIGCMSETSCGTLAGAALAPLCDWADLDGPFLTTNNPFRDPDFRDGKWVLSDEAGLGLVAG
ncbi:dipeptide epimerase [Flavihumibacter sp. R14]|nr:dipeptide epimerase [Flavihumibacter soli]